MDGSSSTYRYAAEFGTDLCGQPDALRLAAGESGGGAVQAQVVQAHGGKEFQPAADLIQHAPGNLHLTFVELPVAHRHQGARHRQRR